MQPTLKILMLEDSASDAELIQRMLKKAKWQCDFTTVMTREALLQALEGYRPDLILADNSLPQFNAAEALKIVRQLLPDIPFILVTGSMPDEFAAAIIKSGADDYILKDRLSRLPDAIDMALKQRRVEKERQETYRKLIESEEKFRNLLEAAPDALVIVDDKGFIQIVNAQMEKLFGFSRDEITGRHAGLLVPDRYSRSPLDDLIDYFKHPRAPQMTTGQELFGRKKDGQEFPVEISLSPLETAEGPLIIAAIRDITERKKAEESLRKLEKEIAEQALRQQKVITEVTIQAQEKERNELGRELHDNINQVLATVKLYLTMFLETPDKNEELIVRSETNVKYAIEEIRKLSKSLVAPSLGDIGLEDALLELVEEANLTKTLQVELLSELNNKDIDRNMELMIYRIAQEQLNNIRKYAKAQNAIISVKTEEDYLSFVIADNGIGFDSSQKAHGIGLKNIGSRVDFYAGSLNILSAPGKGCRIEINIPLH